MTSFFQPLFGLFTNLTLFSCVSWFDRKKASFRLGLSELYLWNYESGLPVLCLVSNQLFSGKFNEEELQVERSRNLPCKFRCLDTLLHVIFEVLASLKYVKGRLIWPENFQ
jgi:hypothetical protein